MNLSRRVFDDISQPIGSRENPTPLVRLNRLSRPGGGEIFAKLEWMNPFGSIKDRTARFLLNGLLRDGKLSGKKIVEPTSGNTGIAVVALSNLLCIPCTITIPSGAPEEKIILLRLLGAEIRDQTEGKVTHLFAGYGTCGTITGVAKFLKEGTGLP